MFISVNGIDFFYKQAGSGDPFILLHGNSENHKKFDSLIDKLAEKYTGYAIDSRGHGQSSKVDKISYKDMMEDVAAFIMNLGLKKPILPERYTKVIAESIPNAECLILNRETHSSYIKHSERVYKAIRPFLDGIEESDMRNVKINNL